LREYLKAWGGIIFWGLRYSKMGSTPRFVYIDCFSYKGIYPEGDMDEPDGNPVYGSPIIGIQAIDDLEKLSTKENYPIEIYTILIEKEKNNYTILIETLCNLGYEDRIKTASSFNGLRSGDIMVLNADSTKLSKELVSFTNRKDTWALYLLDPYGPMGIPYNFVELIVKGRNHDVMINFIYQDFLRKSGMLFIDDLDPQHESLIDNWRKVFGPNVWEKEILAYLENNNYAQLNPTIEDRAEIQDKKEEVFVNGYAQALKKMDPTTIIKHIGLRYPSRERTMLYLFLTTHDPTGALKINEVLYDTQLIECEFRHKIPMARKIRKGQISFLNNISDGIRQDQELTPRPEKEEISEAIFEQFSDKITKRKKIYKAFVETDYFPQDIDKGIRHLRKEGLCQFSGKLTHKTKIVFNQPK
jgi:three-Cys-motif partner protein